MDEESLARGRVDMLDKLKEKLEMVTEKPPTQNIHIDDGGRIILLTKVVVDMTSVSSLKKYFAYFE